MTTKPIYYVYYKIWYLFTKTILFYRKLNLFKLQINLPTLGKLIHCFMNELHYHVINSTPHVGSLVKGHFN